MSLLQDDLLPRRFLLLPCFPFHLLRCQNDLPPLIPRLRLMIYFLRRSYTCYILNRFPNIYFCACCLLIKLVKNLSSSHARNVRNRPVPRHNTSLDSDVELRSDKIHTQLLFNELFRFDASKRDCLN